MKRFICSNSAVHTSNLDKMKLIPSKTLFSQTSGSKIKDFIICTIFLLFLIGGKYKMCLNNFLILILLNSWLIDFKTYICVF